MTFCKQGTAGCAFDADIRLCLHYVCFCLHYVCFYTSYVCLGEGGWLKRGYCDVEEKTSNPTLENGANPHFYFSLDSTEIPRNPSPLSSDVLNEWSLKLHNILVSPGNISYGGSQVDPFSQVSFIGVGQPVTVHLH